MIVVITDEAEEDFERIGDYISQFNRPRAVTFVDDLVERCMLLSTMPLRYALAPGHEGDAIRRMPYRNYIIYYRVEPGEVVILRILNAAQDHEQVVFPPEQP